MDLIPERPWIRVHLARLGWLCHEAPERLRWHWRKRSGTGSQWQVVSHRGVAWNFRLNGGAWLQKDT